MVAFLSGLSAMTPIFIMLALGYILARMGRLDDKTARFMSWFVLSVALPCSIFKTIIGHFALKDILGYGRLVVYPYAIMAVTLLMGLGLARLSGTPKKTAGAFAVLVALNNTIFMGLPVNLALYGEESTPFVLCYYIANTTLFWTVGVAIIARSADARSGNRLKKILLSPPLIVIVASAVYLVVRNFFPSFAVPQAVTGVIGTFGSMSTPLAMMYIGYVLAKSRLRSIRITKPISLGLVGRFILAPAVSVAVFMLAPMGSLARRVFITQSFMPVMASLSIVAGEYGADEEYCAQMVAISNLICLIILPAVSAFLEHFGI